MGAKRMSQREAEGSLWLGFEDFVIDGNLFSFTDHAGIDLRDVSAERIWDKLPIIRGTAGSTWIAS
jgi:hypothetical protein